ncbi:hypothetical protein RDABS01_026933 [Bienertia sinuspersici]
MSAANSVQIEERSDDEIVANNSQINAEAEGWGETWPKSRFKFTMLEGETPNEKPYAKISDTMLRVVGTKAAQFISECSRWVKEYCPLNARNWKNMDKTTKDRLYDKIQMNTPQGEVQLSQQSEGLDGTSLEADSEQQGDPLHATTGLMEPDAEANLKALRELHEKQLQEHGVDNLTPQEAFPMVLNECSGYIRGLGAGPKPPKKTRGASDEECALRAKIERVKQKRLERENKLRQESIDRENRLKQESIEREKKMRAELMAELMSMMQSST